MNEHKPKRSLLPKTLRICLEVHGCCTLEVENIFSSMYDHIKPWTLTPSPPHKANLLIVSGWLTPQLQTHIKIVYEKLPADKKVIAIGVCSLSGAVYQDQPAGSVDQILPVSVFVPGCPPSPEQIISGIQLALKTEKSTKTQENFLNVC